MILDNFLLQQDAFRKLLHPEVEHLDPLSEIEAWEHVELRNLWFAYIRDRWTYPSNLYFTEAITYFLHEYCHGSEEHPLGDNAATMVRLDNLWAEFRDSLPFINDDGTLLRAHREASQHAMDDVLTILRAVHEMCEDPTVFDKHADNLGLIGAYRDLPLIWERHPGNHFYAPVSFDGSANSDESEILEDGQNGDEFDDDSDSDNENGTYRPYSNRHENRHHVTNRRRSCDLYYDAPSNSQNSPPPAPNQAWASHNDRPSIDGRRQFEHGTVENSRNYRSPNQPHYQFDTQRRAVENRNQTQHAHYRPRSQEPLLTRAFYPAETGQDFTDNNNYLDRNRIDHRQPQQAQTQNRPPHYIDQIQTRSDIYQSHHQNDHLNSTHYHSNTQYGQNPNKYCGSSHQEDHRNVTNHRDDYQGDSRSSTMQDDFRPKAESRFDGPRPRDDLDQYHLGSNQDGNNHSSSADHNSHHNSPGIFNRYGDRLRGSYGTGAPLPPTNSRQNQRNPSASRMSSTMCHADSNNSGVYLSHGSPLATPEAGVTMGPVPFHESSTGSNSLATAVAITFSFQSRRFQFDQPDHPRFLSQTVDRRSYYPPVVTARPQGYTTAIATTASLVTQDLSGPTSASNTSGLDLLPPEGDGHGQVGKVDRDGGNNDDLLERNDGDDYDAGNINEEDADNEESEEDEDCEETEESSDNDESDNKSSTSDFGGSRDDDDGDSGDNIGHDGGEDDRGHSSKSSNDYGHDDHDHYSGNSNSQEENDDNRGQHDGTTQDNNANEANHERSSDHSSQSYSRISRPAIGRTAPELSEKNVKDVMASIQPVMTEYGEYLMEKRKAFEGPLATLEKRRVALRELKRVAQRAQDQFDERDALATQAKSIDFQFRVCDDEMSKVLQDISMSNTYMSSALKRKRGQ